MNHIDLHSIILFTDREHYLRLVSPWDATVVTLRFKPCLSVQVWWKLKDMRSYGTNGLVTVSPRLLPDPLSAPLPWCQCFELGGAYPKTVILPSSRPPAAGRAAAKETSWASGWIQVVKVRNGCQQDNPFWNLNGYFASECPLAGWSYVVSCYFYM